MKKKIYLLISIAILVNVFACSGYKPIFSSSNLNFKIVEHSIKGDKKLGNQIYSRLYTLSRSAKDTIESKNLSISIDISKTKTSTAKNTDGKTTAYKISLSTLLIVNDFTSDKKILNENFTFSSSYKVQEQYSDTLKLENKSIENLLDKTYQNLLVSLSESIL